LDRDETCDVAIIGAGVTGALVADALVAAGRDVVVLDRGQPGLGSTSASTALVQFELDIELEALGGMIGRERAVRAYRRCRDAIPRLESLCRELGGCGYTSRSSLYLASRRRDRARLKKETELRQESGLDAEWWPKERVEARYGFPSHGAIRTTTAGELDALQLTRALLARATGAGCRVYSRTAMTDYATAAGGVTVRTNRAHGVKAGTLVYAMGYEVPSIIRQDLVKLNSSYAIATEVVEDFGRWDDRCLVWESARPYCYLRTTPDDRVLVGGEDVPFRDPTWRDRLLPDKRKRLEKRMASLLPSLATTTAFAWAGTFGETADGLPYIGRAEGFPHVLFALGYGGNGIPFSMIASELLIDTCCGREDRDATLFAIDRPRPR
jgi:glycine/D-amino acid oxidase-like deaminating enzyme